MHHSIENGTKAGARNLCCNLGGIKGGLDHGVPKLGSWITVGVLRCDAYRVT